MLERHGGNDVFIIPGGKLEPGESDDQAVIREMMEEFKLPIAFEQLEKFGVFESQAVHTPTKKVRISAFLINNWKGEITLNDGIEEVVWINTKNIEKIKVSPIAKEVVPLLKERGLID